MPKLKTLQIVWHEKQPVYSIDFSADGSLATAGGDKEIKIWRVRASLSVHYEDETKIQKFKLRLNSQRARDGPNPASCALIYVSDYLYFI